MATVAAVAEAETTMTTRAQGEFVLFALQAHHPHLDVLVS